MLTFSPLFSSLFLLGLRSPPLLLLFPLSFAREFEQELSCARQSTALWSSPFFPKIPRAEPTTPTGVGLRPPPPARSQTCSTHRVTPQCRHQTPLFQPKALVVLAESVPSRSAIETNDSRPVKNLSDHGVSARDAALTWVVPDIALRFSAVADLFLVCAEVFHRTKGSHPFVRCDFPA